MRAVVAILVAVAIVAVAAGVGCMGFQLLVVLRTRRVLARHDREMEQVKAALVLAGDSERQEVATRMLDEVARLARFECDESDESDEP